MPLPHVRLHADQLLHAQTQSIGCGHGAATHCRVSSRSRAQPTTCLRRTCVPSPPHEVLHASQPPQGCSGHFSSDTTVHVELASALSVASSPGTPQERRTTTMWSFDFKPKPSSSPSPSSTVRNTNNDDNRSSECSTIPSQHLVKAQTWRSRRQRPSRARPLSAKPLLRLLWKY